MKQREEFGLAKREKETGERRRGKEALGSTQRWRESKEKKREREMVWERGRKLGWACDWTGSLVREKREKGEAWARPMLRLSFSSLVLLLGPTPFSSNLDTHFIQLS